MPRIAISHSYPALASVRISGWVVFGLWMAKSSPSGPLHQGPVHHGYDGSSHRDPAVVPEAALHSDVDFLGSHQGIDVGNCGHCDRHQAIQHHHRVHRLGSPTHRKRILSTLLLGPLSKCLAHFSCIPVTAFSSNIADQSVSPTGLGGHHKGQRVGGCELLKA